TNLWNSTKSIFNKLKNWVIKLWTSLKNKIVSVAKSLYNSVKSRWNALWNTTKSIFSKLKNWAIKTWNGLKNKIISIVKSLWNGVKNRWNALWNGTRSIFNKVKNFMTSTWTKIKSSVVNTVKSLWSKVKGTFNNMNNGLKNIIGKIKGHISGMVNKVKSGLNKLIEGVNWVADKIGMDKLPKIKLHTGTESTHTQNYVTNGKLNRNTLATVGDKGKGNGPGGFRHETIIPPKGKPFITPAKDTTMPLSKGTRILNGAQTHAMLTRPQFNMGTIPKFAKGTKKKGFFSNANDIVKDVAGDFGQGVKNTAHSAAKVGKEKIGDVAEVAKEAVSDAIAFGKDIFEYIDNPMELINKVIDKFGVNFDFLKGAELPYKLMQAMFKKLKNGVKDLVKGWLEDMGGGDGGYLFDYPIWQRFGHYTGGLSFNGGRHYGMDFGMPTGTPIYAVKGGVADKVWTDYGGGKSVQIKTGANEWNWYMHLSKQIAKQGQKIRAGQLIGKSGATGNFVRGAHLHFQLMRGSHAGNDTAVNPESWLKSLKGSGGSQNKSASRWKSDIRRAAKQMRVSLSSRELNGIVAQIQRESNGNAGVTQGNIGDINNLRGTPAQGLLQYVPSTFAGYAVKGHKNIKNGYDQLLAFFNNSNWRRDLPYGRSGWSPTGSRRFAKGTNKAPKGFSTVFEEGGEIMNLRGGEQIIPNDVSIAAIERVINSDIFNRTQSAVYEAISRFADGIREEKDKQQQTEMRRNLEYQALKEQNVKLTSLVEKMDAIISTLFNLEDSNERIANKSNVIDRYSLGEEVNTIVDKRERHKNRKARFKPSVT
ncbi:peptidase M23, partial [Staphylococcus haemolyticus]